MIMQKLLFFLLIISTQVFSLSPPSKPPNWDNWKFNEKIIWRGCNLDPRIPYAPLVDKLKVKKIVQNEMPTAELFFATNDPSQIFMENLPNTFVMKVNNASGRGVLVKNGIIVATKKRDQDFIPRECTNNYLRLYAKKWLKNLYAENTEKQYGLVQPMILFEEYLESLKMDIELYFFNGKVVVIGLFFTEDYTKNPIVSFYDASWNLFDISHPKFLVKKEPIEKPPYMDKLIAFGERFAEKIDHVRIDFFVTEEEIYFGEFTFTTAGGYEINHLNQMIGNHWDYPDPDDSLVNPYLNELLDNAGCLER